MTRLRAGIRNLPFHKSRIKGIVVSFFVLVLRAPCTSFRGFSLPEGSLSRRADSGFSAFLSSLDNLGERHRYESMVNGIAGALEVFPLVDQGREGKRDSLSELCWIMSERRHRNWPQPRPRTLDSSPFSLSMLRTTCLAPPSIRLESRGRFALPQESPGVPAWMQRVHHSPACGSGGSL